MTRNETVDLLTAISAYDNRTPAQAAVAAWGKAAELGRWTLPEALDAVHQHFANSAEYLMPAHITAAVKAARADAAMREPTVHPDPLGQARVAELIQNAFRAIGDGTEGDPDGSGRRAALARRCPYCAAEPHEPCTRPSRGGRVRLTEMHPSRREGAA